MAARGSGGMDIGDAVGIEERNEGLGLAASLPGKRAFRVVLAAIIRPLRGCSVPEQDERARLGQECRLRYEIGLGAMSEQVPAFVDGNPANGIDFGPRGEGLAAARTCGPEVNLLRHPVHEIVQRRELGSENGLEAGFLVALADCGVDFLLSGIELALG